MSDSLLWTDVAFGDTAGWEDFMFRHSQSHSAIAQAIYQKFGTLIGSVVFSEEGNIQNWLKSNSDAHAEEMQALGVQAINIASVDLSDQQQYNDWMVLHAQIHQAEEQALGL